MKVPWRRTPTGDYEIDSLEDSVYEKLDDNNYGMLALQNTPHEDPGFLDICKRLLNGLKANRWVVIVSNSRDLLDELGSVFPVIYAINNLGKSVITINGSELVDLLMENRNPRNLERDFVVKHNLVYIHNFLSKGKLLAQLEGGIDSLFNDCVKRKLIIDIHSDKDSRGPALEDALRRVEFNAGSRVAASIRQDFAALHFYDAPTENFLGRII